MNVLIYHPFIIFVGVAFLCRHPDTCPTWSILCVSVELFSHWPTFAKRGDRLFVASQHILSDPVISFFFVYTDSASVTTPLIIILSWNYFVFSQLLFLVDQQPGDWWVNLALSSFPCDFKLILITDGLSSPSAPSSSQGFMLLASCLWPHSSSSTIRSVLQPCFSSKQCT